MILRLAWSENRRNVRAVRLLSSRQHGNDLLQTAYPAGGENMKSAIFFDLLFLPRAKFHFELQNFRRRNWPGGTDTPRTGWPDVMGIYSFLKSRALTFLPDSILQPLRVWHHRRTLQSTPDVDEPDLTVVRELVESGSTAVDLGANIGVYTKVLSDLVGPTGSVISVEPVPQTFEVLSRLIRSLGMSNVSCVNAAISDRAGEVVMELPNYKTGGTNFYQATVVATTDDDAIESTHHVRVPSLTLDALVAGKGKIGFVKCDVEGHELACLSGAQTMLGSYAPAWLVEVLGNPDESGTRAQQTFGIFNSLSYVSWWFDGHRLIKRRAGDRSTNYFFLKDEHIAHLRNRAPRFFEEHASTRAVKTSD